MAQRPPPGFDGGGGGGGGMAAGGGGVSESEAAEFRNSIAVLSTISSAKPKDLAHNTTALLHLCHTK